MAAINPIVVSSLTTPSSVLTPQQAQIRLPTNTPRFDNVNYVPFDTNELHKKVQKDQVYGIRNSNYGRVLKQTYNTTGNINFNFTTQTYTPLSAINLNMPIEVNLVKTDPVTGVQTPAIGTDITSILNRYFTNTSSVITPTQAALEVNHPWTGFITLFNEVNLTIGTNNVALKDNSTNMQPNLKYILATQQPLISENEKSALAKMSLFPVNLNSKGCTDWASGSTPPVGYLGSSDSYFTNAVMPDIMINNFFKVTKDNNMYFYQLLFQLLRYCRQNQADNQATTAVTPATFNICIPLSLLHGFFDQGEKAVSPFLPFLLSLQCETGWQHLCGWGNLTLIARVNLAAYQDSYLTWALTEFEEDTLQALAASYITLPQLYEFPTWSMSVDTNCILASGSVSTSLQIASSVPEPEYIVIFFQDAALVNSKTQYIKKTYGGAGNGARDAWVGMNYFYPFIVFTQIVVSMNGRETVFLDITEQTTKTVTPFGPLETFNQITGNVHPNRERDANRFRYDGGGSPMYLNIRGGPYINEDNTKTVTNMYRGTTNIHIKLTYYFPGTYVHPGLAEIKTPLPNDVYARVMLCSTSQCVITPDGAVSIYTTPSKTDGSQAYTRLLASAPTI